MALPLMMVSLRWEWFRRVREALLSPPHAAKTNVIIKMTVNCWNYMAYPFPYKPKG
jgi:hypothetical protein